MKWNEMKWNEMKWNEINENKNKIYFVFVWVDEMEWMWNGELPPP